MVIGIPKEIKTHEYRVAVTPEGVRELSRAGHKIFIEQGAGLACGFSDSQYKDAGAPVMDKERLFKESALIVKVKEPLSSEYELFREGQALFTFLHLAPNPELIGMLIDKKITALGYETLEEEGRLPLLQPMSEIAGRMSPIVAGYYLQRTKGGSGLLPTGAVGVLPANILIIGGGSVGENAARVALGIGMRVTVVNRGIDRLRRLDEMFSGKVNTLPSMEYNIRGALKDADIVIGAVLLIGAKAPVLITEEMVKGMKKGSVIVDVSIDQGGCIETSKPTTHENPVYEAHGIIHYAVTNMPGAYPRTSTMALTNCTLPYIKRLVDMGIEIALRKDRALRTALNIYDGKVTHKGLSDSTGIPLGEI
ncbi:MAG: alanine dehydrogenase [Nitrospirae bacterium]|nr:alanine dehydrogenase [Nitrospirota bacterium]